MKIEGKQLRFSRPFVPRWRERRLNFSGKKNSLQLQETALVVEGALLKVHFLGMERFFRQALSERTTVTIPYNRIEVAKARTPWVLRAIILLLPFVLGCAGMCFPSEGDSVAAFFGAIVLGVIALPLLLLLRTKYRISYRAKDGRRWGLYLRIKGRALRREFDAALQKQRTAAKKHQQANGVAFATRG